MTRAKYILLSAACAVPVAAATPALALTPQPLPPGYHSSAHGQPAGFNCANGNHIRR